MQSLLITTALYLAALNLWLVAVHQPDGRPHHSTWPGGFAVLGVPQRR